MKEGTKTIIGRGAHDKFWTLWKMYAYKKIDRVNGGSFLEIRFDYIKNLSKDLEEAKAKVPNFDEIDENLSGGRSFATVYWGDLKEDGKLPFGKYRGQEWRKVLEQDPSYLVWASLNLENKAARKFLLSQPEIMEIIEAEQIERFKKAQQFAEERKSFAVHFGEDGARYFAELEQVSGKRFDSDFYGAFYVVTYKTAKGAFVTYKGSNPPIYNIKPTGEKVKISFTVNHDSYKGEPQTIIKRPSDKIRKGLEEL